MKRRKNVIRQAGIYLLLLVISPFICAALVRAVSEPIEMLTETAQTTVGMTVDNITADSISADRESSSYTESIYTEKTIPKENTFRIITDDSFIKPYGGLHIPSADNEDSEAFAPPEIAPGEADESLEYPGTDGTVDIVTYGKMSGSDYIDIGGGQLRNMTEFSAETILTTAEKMSFTPLLRDGTPEILIYHTHATESYLPAASDVYDTNFPFRSTDKSINMVAVGNAISEELEKVGFGVIHDTTLYDKESYNGSYEASRAGVTKILSEYPTIKVVLDVHRDALQKSDTEIVAPTVTINGKQSAQIMIVSNCTSDTLKYPIPNYKENLKLALLINSSAESLSPGLMRPVLFDYRQYNQDLSTGSLLIEVGGHGNSLEQALYAGKLFGAALGDALGG